MLTNVGLRKRSTTEGKRWACRCWQTSSTKPFVVDNKLKSSRDTWWTPTLMISWLIHIMLSSFNMWHLLWMTGARWSSTVTRRKVMIRPSLISAASVSTWNICPKTRDELFSTTRNSCQTRRSKDSPPLRTPSNRTEWALTFFFFRPKILYIQNIHLMLLIKLFG